MDAGELLVLFCYRVLQHCHQHDNLCTMQTRAVAQTAEEVSPSLPPTPVISFLRPFTCTSHGHCFSSLLSILHTYAGVFALHYVPFLFFTSSQSHTHIPTHPHANTHKRTLTRTHVHTHVHTHTHVRTHAHYSIAPTCVFSLKRAPSRWPLNWMRQW